MSATPPDPPAPRQTDDAPGAAPGREPRRDDRSSVSKGVQWASVGTTIAMEMAGAPLIGYGVDYLTGWFPWATLAFTAVGFWLGVSQLIAAANKVSSGSGPSGGMRGPRR
ncbi:hypothetical protein [Alienimonas sp. DA493]|uniref:AtpZ/AtpI family protein n=1 Tax=Alienimonas sp. DA493 TaxID=3373605 RepID=UPI00375468CC